MNKSPGMDSQIPLRTMKAYRRAGRISDPRNEQGTFIASSTATSFPLLELHG